MATTAQTQEIEAPTRRTRDTGLFASFPPLVMSGPKELNGAYWQAEACDGPDGHEQGGQCPDPTGSRVEKELGTKPYDVVDTCLNVSLIAGIDCETVGSLADPMYQSDYLYGVAQRRLRAGASYALARMISTGKAWKRTLDDEGCWTGEWEEAFPLTDCVTEEAATPFCVPVDVEQPCPDKVSPIAALSNFESRIGDLTTGHPVIYMPSGAAVFLVGDHGPVEKVGKKFYTRALETEVVFGWGFTGYGPDGTEPEPGCAWSFMRGAPRIHRSGDYPTHGNDLASGIQRDNNGRQFWAEEHFTVGFDNCLPLAQQMELC